MVDEALLAYLYLNFRGSWIFKLRGMKKLAFAYYSTLQVARMSLVRPR